MNKIYILRHCDPDGSISLTCSFDKEKMDRLCIELNEWKNENILQDGNDHVNEGDIIVLYDRGDIDQLNPIQTISIPDKYKKYLQYGIAHYTRYAVEELEVE